MTKSTATVAQIGLFAATPQTMKSGVVMSFLDRLIPEGYEDSSGFHYGKVPPFVVLNTDACNRQNVWFSDKGEIQERGTRQAPQHKELVEAAAP